jgi:hypothetical protein
MTSEYVDTTQYFIQPIDKDVAKKLIVTNHYTHRWTMCYIALGIFKKGPESEFMTTNQDELIGSLVYGHPTGMNVVKSISDELETNNVLELTRLWIEDNHGKNIESWAIAQSFDWFKKNESNLKVLISYADPGAGHTGRIYQATNWKYQFIKSTGDGTDYVYAFEEPPNCQWKHARSIGAMLGGSRDPKYVEETLKRPFWRKEINRRKFRYIYFLCDKREKKRLIKTLKHPVSDSYPKDLGEVSDTIEKFA